MELSIPAIISIFVLVWALNGFLREYLISRALKQAYEQELQRVLTDPSSQVKGRFE